MHRIYDPHGRLLAAGNTDHEADLLRTVPDLRRVDFSRIDLRNADLTGLPLANLDLGNARLAGVRLDGTLLHLDRYDVIIQGNMVRLGCVWFPTQLIDKMKPEDFGDVDVNHGPSSLRTVQWIRRNIERIREAIYETGAEL